MIEGFGQQAFEGGETVAPVEGLGRVEADLVGYQGWVVFEKTGHFASGHQGAPEHLFDG